jgi:DNA-3-methyladenine glycosylase
MADEVTSLVPLPRKFFAPSAAVVARRLLGHYLVRRIPGGFAGGTIVEAEAYLAHDPASHGFKRETPRNRSMYGPPGRAYVYFIYGNHHCFNAVCGEPGVPEAVLIRAIAPAFGLEWMRTRRSGIEPPDLTNGPGKLCAALDIGRELDGVDLCQADAAVLLAANPRLARTRHSLGPVRITPRIGISLAAELPLRFLLAGSDSISRGARAWRAGP